MFCDGIPKYDRYIIAAVVKQRSDHGSNKRRARRDKRNQTVNTKVFSTLRCNRPCACHFVGNQGEEEPHKKGCTTLCRVGVRSKFWQQCHTTQPTSFGLPLHQLRWTHLRRNCRTRACPYTTGIALLLACVVTSLMPLQPAACFVLRTACCLPSACYLPLQ